MSVSSFEIGTTYAGRVNVETLSALPSIYPGEGTKFIPYSETVDCIDGSSYARGFPSAVWRFGFIPGDMWAALRAICPAASVSVVIRTTGENNVTFGYYSAIMHWPELPDGYEFRGHGTGTEGAFQPVEFRFSNLATYTP